MLNGKSQVIFGVGKPIHYIFLFLCFLILLETTSYAVARYLADKGIFYILPEVTTKDYSKYLAQRDKILGWPSHSSFGRGDVDRSGSRIIPSFPLGSKPCISLYGDSFTWSGGVDNEHAWSNVLSKKMKCRVSNYGIGGGGTDQAYLRFKHNVEDKADIVILGHLSENILRNVNQYREFLYPGSLFGLKPRFIAHEGGKIELIPLLNFSESEFPLFLKNPEIYLQNEYFIPGGPSGKQRLAFPYTWRVLRAVNHFHIQAKLAGKPRHADFYLPNHPSKGLDVTAGIIKLFHNDALATGKKPVLIIIPTGLDLVYFHEKKIWAYQALLDKLHAANLEPLNIGSAMIEVLSNREPCELFYDCSGHFNEEGYGILAEIVYQHLAKSDLLSG